MKDEGKVGGGGGGGVGGGGWGRGGTGGEGGGRGVNLQFLHILAHYLHSRICC